MSRATLASDESSLKRKEVSSPTGWVLPASMFLFDQLSKASLIQTSNRGILIALLEHLTCVESALLGIGSASAGKWHAPIPRPQRAAASALTQRSSVDLLRKSNFSVVKADQPRPARSRRLNEKVVELSS